MAKITIDDFTLGLMPRYWQTTQSNRLQYNYGMLVSGSCNPHRYPGYYCPGSTTATELANEDQLDTNNPCSRFVAVEDSNLSTGNSYPSFYASNANKIQGIIYTSDKIAKSTDHAEFPHTINATAGTHDGHTSEIIDDMVLYQINGVQKLCYFYRDSVDGDMGTYDLISSFTTDDANEAVLSTSAGGAVLDKKFPIIPIVADNGFMYIANGTAIHKFDGNVTGGANGTMTGNVIVLSSYRRVVDMIDGLGKIWILTAPSYKTQVGVQTYQRKISILIWNRLSSTVGIEDNIIIDDVVDAFNLFFLNGIPHVFTRSHAGVYQLRKWNGRIFEVIRELGVLGISPATRGSVIQYDNGVAWLSDTGKIFYYGKPFAESENEGLYLIGTPLNANIGGAMIRYNTSFILCSYAVNDSFSKLSIWKPEIGTASYEQDLYTRMIDLPKLSTINHVDVFFMDEAGSAPNTNVSTIYLYTGTTTIGEKQYTVTTTDLARGYIHLPFRKVDANKIQIRMTMNALISNTPKLYRIEVDYTPNNKLK